MKFSELQTAATNFQSIEAWRGGPYLIILLKSQNQIKNTFLIQNFFELNESVVTKFFEMVEIFLLL